MKVHTHSKVASMLDYNPLTGLFRWKVNTRGKLNRGGVAGSVRNDGYVFVGIGRTKYRAARLAWCYMNKRWPRRFVDHKDGNPSNNRWDNLRQADEYTNQQNRRGSRFTNNPYKGIYWSKRARKWAASIRKDGKEKYLGLHPNAIQAAMAYDSAALEMFGEFAKINFPEGANV